MENNKKALAPIIIGINAVVFALMWLSDRQLSSQTLIDFGAKYNYAIVEGQWWRLFTANFLHLDFMHLVFNMSALFILSGALEQIFGKGKFLTIYLGSGLGGALMSFAFSNSLSAGASGAIFGLMGAHLYLYAKNKETYRRVFGSDFLILIAFNLIYGFINPGIDNFGHVGGLITGFVLCYGLGIRYEPIKISKRLVSGLVIILLSVSMVAFGYTRFEGSVDYYLAAIIDHVQEGDEEAALDALYEAYDKYPDDPRILDIISRLQ